METAKKNTASPVPEDEIIRRIHACKSYREWFEVTKSLPADDGGYDIVEALEENRRSFSEAPSGKMPGRRK